MCVCVCVRGGAARDSCAPRIPPYASFPHPPPPKPHVQDLTYGETPFDALARPLALIEKRFGGLPAPGTGVFADIGCGTGKPLFAAALLHEWRACRGVEIVEELLGEAETLVEAWEGGLPYAGPKGSKETLFRIPRACRAAAMELFCGDAAVGGGGVGGGAGAGGGAGGAAARWSALKGDGLAADGGGFEWAEVDVAYACSTCFSEGLLSALAGASAAAMKPGSFFITSSAALEHPSWEVVAEEVHRMSWGPATVYLQRKRLPREGKN